MEQLGLAGSSCSIYLVTPAQLVPKVLESRYTSNETETFSSTKSETFNYGVYGSLDKALLLEARLHSQQLCWRYDPWLYMYNAL